MHISPTLKAQISPDLNSIEVEQVRDDLTNIVFGFCSIYMNEEAFKYNEGVTKIGKAILGVLKDEEISFWSLISLVEEFGWK